MADHITVDSLDAMANNDPYLTIENLKAGYGRMEILHDLNLRVARKQSLCLIGPNGAGKTTLFALISGFLRPDEGSVRYRDGDVIGQRPHQLAAQGLVRTFQIVRPFPTLTVRENITIAAHTRIGPRRDATDKAEEVARGLGMAALLDQIAGDLPMAGRKRLEVARAVATDPALLLLDEVMAGLNDTELQASIDMVRSARDELGITIIWVEHVMKAVMSLAERVVVLNFGRTIADGVPTEVMNQPDVVTAYLGGEVAS